MNLKPEILLLNEGGETDLEKFDGKLEFDLTLIPYEGNDDWVEGVIKEVHKCLNSGTIPEANEDCDYCAYRESVKAHNC